MKNDHEELDELESERSLRRPLIFAGLVGTVLLAGLGFYLHHDSKPKPPFVEGVHYRILEKPYSAKARQVDDYYWLNCDSCYMFEGILKGMTASGYSINKIHAVSNDLWLDDAKLDTTFRMVNREDLIDKFFSAAILRKGFTKDRSAMNEFLTQNNVNVDQFWNQYSSPSSLAQAIDRARFSENVDIKVVPTFVLDGKYKLILGRLKDNAELKDLVNYLEATQPNGSLEGAN